MDFLSFSFNDNPTTPVKRTGFLYGLRDALDNVFSYVIYAADTIFGEDVRTPESKLNLITGNK